MELNPHFRLVLLSLIAILVLGAGPGAAADWPQYLGPSRNGVSPETNLARTWPEGGPRVVWELPLGAGFGGPAIRDGEVFVLDRELDLNDILRCIDLETGEEKWQYKHHTPGAASYNGSRTAPTVTDKYVFTVGLTGRFYCIDRSTQQPKWIVDLAEEFPPDGETRWGYAQSPSLYKDTVIVAPQSAKAHVAAFNQETGELVWANTDGNGYGYSTPRIGKVAGVDQVLMTGGGNPAIMGIDPNDGKTLWQYAGWQCRIPIPSPTPLPGDRVFITGEYGAGSAMIRIVNNNGTFDVEELYTTNVCGSQIHQPLLIGDYLYMNSNGNQRADGMLCLSLDGEMQWRSRDARNAPRFERGGLIAVDGMIVNFDGRRGTLCLIEPSPDEYREVASAKVFDGSQMWAPLAYSRGKLLVRSQEAMKCFQLGQL
jgi:outer membrane protein assembly factor BamB